MVCRFVSYRELKSLYGLPWTRQHVDRLIRAKKFPSKIRISERRVGWWSTDIETWVSSKEAATR